MRYHAMPNYRRAFIPGGTYFFTVNLADRGKRTLTDQIDALRTAFAETKRRLPFRMDAVVVLPEHLHCMWVLPPGDSDFSRRWQQIKTRFSQSLPRGEHISSSRVSKGEREIWQRRFWEHTIRDDTDYQAHMHYIHYNPLKHGHVQRVRDWPHSSFHRLVNAGVYPLDWCGSGEEEAEIECGERR